MEETLEWDEEWEEDEESTGAGGAEEPIWSPASRAEGRVHASLALGLLAMAPLFLAYELGLAQDPDLPRSQSEQVLFRLLSLFPTAAETWLRQGILLGAVVGALVVCYRRRVALGPSLLRVFLEGVLGAVALGPALAYGMRLFGGFENEVAPLAVDTSLPVAGRVVGAAAFEELLFRVALYGIVFLLARRVAAFFGARERVSGLLAEGLALVLSSLGFAAIHLAVFTTWLGPEGEAFDPAIFTWRFLAGVMLALLFRWRGPGVAAWSHGLFNLALLIGAGPEVLL